MINKVTIIGNLGKEPEVKQTSNGGNVARFSVACSESWTDKNTNEKKTATEWIPVTLFGKLADIASQYLHKGSKVYVEGKFKTQKWTDKNGQDRYSTYVEVSGFNGILKMLDSKPTGTQQQQTPVAEPAPTGGFDDDIPF